MRSPMGSSSRQTLLDELKAKHKARYDSVDNVHWGCICELGTDCLYIILIGALNKAEQETIRALADLKKEHEQHLAEVKVLSSEIAGLETYNRRLKKENDDLQQTGNHGIPGSGPAV